MPRLSIVIPFLGDVGRLEDTLVSVLANRPADCQILVVLSQPYADPYSLAGEVRFLPCEAAPGAALAESIWRGIAASEAPIVHLLGCGREATLGWADAALARFADPRVAAVAALVVDRFDTRRIISAGLQFTAGGAVRPLDAVRSPDNLPAPSGDVLGPDNLSSFYRKAALETVAAWIELAGGPLAGVDWALALQQAGYKAAFEPAAVVAASPEAMTPRGQWTQGLACQRLFWRWAPTRGWAARWPHTPECSPWNACGLSFVPRCWPAWRDVAGPHCTSPPTAGIGNGSRSQSWPRPASFVRRTFSTTKHAAARRASSTGILPVCLHTGW